MLGKFRKYLGSPLPVQYRSGFEADLFGSIFRPTLLVGGLIILLEVGMVLIALARPGLLRSPDRMVYLALYLILLGATLAAVLGAVLGRRRLRKHPRAFIGLTVGYAALICLWGSFLSAYTHKTNADISVFLYVILGVAVVVTLRPWQAIALFVGNQLVFLLLLYHFAGPGVKVYGSVLNSIITTLLCILIASILCNNRVRDYVNRVTIVQQNREINNINQQLRRLVLLDEMTQVNNRRYLEEMLPEQLQKARQAGQAVCVMMFDLDRFKEFNDLYGHPAGDKALISFARILKGCLEDKRGAVVRYGGEEFILCLEGYDEKTGMKAAEEIRRRLEAQGIPHSAGQNGYLTVSTGVRAAHPEEDVSLEQLVSDADQALYIAKNAGRNRVKLFYPG